MSFNIDGKSESITVNNLEKGLSLDQITLSNDKRIPSIEPVGIYYDTDKYYWPNPNMLDQSGYTKEAYVWERTTNAEGKETNFLF